MQRGLVHAAAWMLATGAAVTLSWWGVHTVLAGTVYDPPRALPISGAASARTEPDGGTAPQSSATHRPRPSSSPAAEPGSPSSTPERDPAPRPSGSPSSAGPAATSGNVKSYTVSGGRVVFDLGTSSAELVSATPESGWQMQVWKQPEWIRVNFSADGHTTSVFCTWNDHEPTVEVVTE